MEQTFSEISFEILGVPRKVGLKFRKIGITGKFHSAIPARAWFLRARKSNSTKLVLKLLSIILLLYLTND